MRWLVLVALLLVPTIAGAQDPFPNPFSQPPVPRATLTVTTAGTGSGTVTGTGISCGSDCSQVFNRGVQVTLSASAASGSTFGGWTGGCTGTGSCVVTMAGAKTVQATFSLSTISLTVRFTDNSPSAGGTAESSFNLERCLIVSPASSCSNFAVYSSLPAVAGQPNTITFVDGAVQSTGACYRANALATGALDSAYTNTGCFP